MASRPPSLWSHAGQLSSSAPRVAPCVRCCRVGGWSRGTFARTSSSSTLPEGEPAHLSRRVRPCEALSPRPSGMLCPHVPSRALQACCARPCLHGSRVLPPWDASCIYFGLSALSRFLVFHLSLLAASWDSEAPFAAVVAWGWPGPWPRKRGACPCRLWASRTLAAAAGSRELPGRLLVWCCGVWAPLPAACALGRVLTLWSPVHSGAFFLYLAVPWQTAAPQLHSLQEGGPCPGAPAAPSRQCWGPVPAALGGGPCAWQRAVLGGVSRRP